MLIAIEGIDGAGKSTLMRNLSNRLPSEKYTFCAEFQSPIGCKVKDLLKEKATFFIKTYFFAADRAWTYENIADPAMKAGKTVIWDRYVDSALAYRYAERDKANFIDFNFVKKINEPFQKADKTIYLKIPAEYSDKRAASAGRREPYDINFLKQVEQYYDSLREHNPSYHVIDATKTAEEITDAVCTLLCGLRT